MKKTVTTDAEGKVVSTSTTKSCQGGCCGLICLFVLVCIIIGAIASIH